MIAGTDRVDPEHRPPRGVTPLAGARERQRRWQHLGQVLITRGLLSQEQLAAAFERQRQGSLRLGRVLVELKMISESALLECLALQFDKPLMSEEEIANLPPEVVRILPEETARLNMVTAVGAEDTVDLKQLRTQADDPPVVKLVNYALTRAASDGASDIHVEPFEDRTLIRYRSGGCRRTAVSRPAWRTPRSTFACPRFPRFTVRRSSSACS